MKPLTEAEVLAAYPELAAVLRHLVRREVETMLDGLFEEISDMIAGAPRPARAPAPAPARRGRPINDWLTAKQAARIAGVRPKTVLHWTRIGQLTRYGTRQRVLVSRVELERMLSKGPASWANGHAP